MCGSRLFELKEVERRGRGWMVLGDSEPLRSIVGVVVSFQWRGIGIVGVEVHLVYQDGGGTMSQLGTDVLKDEHRNKRGHGQGCELPVCTPGHIYAVEPW